MKLLRRSGLQTKNRIKSYEKVGIFQNREKVVDSLPGYILAITGYRYNLAMRAKLSIRLSFSTDGTIRPLQSSVGGDGSLKRL